MTIAIALAVMAVVTVAGVWLLRRQADQERDGAARPHVEDGSPGSAEEGPDTHPATAFPWQERPGNRLGDDGLPVHEVPSAATPAAVPERPLVAAEVSPGPPVTRSEARGDAPGRSGPPDAADPAEAADSIEAADTATSRR